MSTLASRLQEVSKGKPRGWKADCARFCRVKPPSVSDWLTGKTASLKAETADRLAQYFGVRLTWLTTGKGPKYSVDREPPPVLSLPAPATNKNEQANQIFDALGFSLEDFAMLSKGDQEKIRDILSVFFKRDTPRKSIKNGA